MRDFSLTVSQLNEYVRKSLAGDPILRRISLTGELGTLKKYPSGHWYFTLKDEEASISCAMFRQYTFLVHFEPENGQKVKLTGSVGLYTKTGSYQFYAETMEPDGVGELYLRFEELKRRLEREGLFDESLKKPLPLLPRGIGIVTSEAGAVLHDIARVTWRRFPGMPLYLYPARVQGEEAAAEIARGLAVLDGLPEVEVLIVGRGGGSMEDLWCFNDEKLARAIARCQKPVISAVGHETDFTIADFVADVRAATPSMAAEIAVPSQRRLLARVEGIQSFMARRLSSKVEEKSFAASSLTKRIQAQSPARQIERTAQKLESLEAALRRNLRLAVDRKAFALEAATKRLALQTPQSTVSRMRGEVDALQSAIGKGWDLRLKALDKRIQQAEQRIRIAGPEATLERGYALVTDGSHLIRSAAELKAGEKVCLRLKDGTAHAVIE